MKEYYLEEKGICYQCNDFRPDRKTLVFLHGLSGSLSAWEDFVNGLESTYNLLTIDLRGQGKSAKPRKYRDYDISEFACDLDALISHLHIDKFVMVAHSFGTLVGLEYLMKHRDTVSSVIFMSPNFKVHVTWQARISLPFIWFGSRFASILPMNTKPGGRLDYSQFVDTGDWNLKRMYEDITNTGFRPYLYCLEHVYKFGHDSDWGRISAPTLIIHGREDTFIPYRNSEELTKEIAGSKLVILERSGHILPLNNSRKIMALIRDFVPA